MVEVILRPISLKDLSNVMNWVNNSEIIGKFRYFKKIITESEEKDFILNVSKSRRDKVFSVFSEEEVYLGQIGLHEIDKIKSFARMAIIMSNRNYHGRGYATAAIFKILRYGFEKRGLKNIWIKILVSNNGMYRLAKKCGFEKERILKKEYPVGGVYQDMIRMSISEKRFIAKLNC